MLGNLIARWQAERVVLAGTTGQAEKDQKNAQFSVELRKALDDIYSKHENGLYVIEENWKKM